MKFLYTDLLILLVTGAMCQNDSSTVFTLAANESSTFTVDNSSIHENTSTDVTETDFDTNGDIKITSEPQTITETVVTSTQESTVSEEHSTVRSTSIAPSTTVETTSLPVEANWTGCSLISCKNDGLCVEDPVDPKLYTCNCSSGYTGLHCQVKDNCVVADDGNSCKGGACFFDKDGLSRACGCFYGKFWNEKEKECTESQLPCFPNPCYNSGKCVKIGDEDYRCDCKSGYEGPSCKVRNKCLDEDQCDNGKCVQNKTSFLKYCECNHNFYWNEEDQWCEEMKAPCRPNPCKNNGVCERVSLEKFNCTCLDGYLGTTCTIQNFCPPSEDGTEACENGVCILEKNQVKCTCEDDYYLDEETHRCKEILQPCFPNPCSNDAMCIPLSSDSYNCSCSEGYTGSHCTELDYCAWSGGNVFCEEAECKNDRHLGMFFCSCGPGQYFDYKSHVCVDVNFCPLIKCGEKERCKDNVCVCEDNYNWYNSTQKCEPNFCAANPCPSDMNCNEDTETGYKCVCNHGYAFNGTHCNNGAICAFPNLNLCDQLCNPTSEDDFTCECKENFKLNEDNHTCLYEGNATCTNATCENGTCVKNGETESCVCELGYKNINGKCIDLCSANMLPSGFCPEEQCEPTDSGFICKCEGKYVLSEDKVTCTVRRMCQASEDGFSTCLKQNAACIEDFSTVEGYRCECSSGQVRKGGVCLDICSIRENQRYCVDLGAECDVDSGNELTCRCPPYFGAFVNGTACNKPASHSYLLTLPLNLDSYKEEKSGRMKRSLIENDIVNLNRVEEDVKTALEIIFPASLHLNILLCSETKDYLLCKLEVQFANISQNHLKRLKLANVCQASKENSLCVMPPSLVLERNFVDTLVTIKKTDPCDADIKDDLCGSETVCSSSTTRNSFNCTCKVGFAVRKTTNPFEGSQSTIEMCKDIDECSPVSPCPINTKCYNTFGNYSCSCLPGFRIKEASHPLVDGCVEICNSNPCVNGHCKTVGDHDFDCRCDTGYGGLLCNSQDKDFKRARNNTIIVGCVLGGCLLITFIISYVLISRIKKKSLDYPSNMVYGTEMTDRRNNRGVINNAYQ